MILIQNFQRAIPIDKEQIQKKIACLLEYLKYDDFDIGVRFVNNHRMQEINHQFRNKDKPTNVLAFPFHHTITAGKRIVAQTNDEKNLGDIIIAPAVIKQEAPELGQSFEERLTLLLVHGLCHLLGYDHETDEQHKKMQKLEQKLLKLIK